MNRIPRARRSPVLVGLVVAVFLFAPSPRADALSMSPDWSQVTFRVTYRACPGPDRDWNPRGQVKLFEYGKSGVVAFSARYQLRAAEGGIAASLAQYDSTYTSSSVPNNAVSYSIKLPANGYHHWTHVILTPRLEVKATWIRVWWKPDWKTQRVVVVCG